MGNRSRDSRETISQRRKFWRFVVGASKRHTINRVLGLALLGAVSFGVGGWIERTDNPASLTAWAEALYRTAQLFTVEMNADQFKDVEWPQWVAGICAIVFLVGTVIVNFGRNLITNLASLWHSFWGDPHAVVIGYGHLGKAVADRLAEKNRRLRVIAIDREIASVDRTAAREISNFALVEMDAFDREKLSKVPVRIETAEAIIITSGSDETNLAVAREVSEWRRERRKRDSLMPKWQKSKSWQFGRGLRKAFAHVREVLRSDRTGPTHQDAKKVEVQLPYYHGVWVHLDHHHLAERLRDAQADIGEPSDKISPFELYEASALDLLLRHSPALEARQAGLQRAHVVIYGFSDFSWHMAEQVLMNARMPAPTFAAPKVTFVVSKDESAEKRWNARHASLRDAHGNARDDLQVDFIEVDQFEEIEWHNSMCELFAGPKDGRYQGIDNGPPPSLHVFAHEDQTVSLTNALSMRAAMKRAYRAAAPIAVFAPRIGANKSDLVAESAIRQNQVMIVGDPWSATEFTGFGGRHLEEFARALHEKYRKPDRNGDPKTRAQHVDPGPFDQQTFTMQLSNRRAAFHFVQKLRLLGFEGAFPDQRTFRLDANGIRSIGKLLCHEGETSHETGDVDEPIDGNRSPTTEFERWNIFEHMRWRTDRFLEGWTETEKERERDDDRRKRYQLLENFWRTEDYYRDEILKDAAHYEEFRSHSKDGANTGWGTRRVVDNFHCGAAPRWTLVPDTGGEPNSRTLRLDLPDGLRDHPQLKQWQKEDPNLLMRRQILLPREPNFDVTGFKNWNEHKAQVQNAIEAAINRWEAETPDLEKAALQFRRWRGEVFEWMPPRDESLEPGEVRRREGVTLPSKTIGFTGHINLAKYDMDPDQLRALFLDELPRLIPEGAHIMTGAASGADEIFLEAVATLKNEAKWHNPPHVTILAPFVGVAETFLFDDQNDCAIDDRKWNGLGFTVRRTEVIKTGEAAHLEVQREILDHSALLIAVCHESQTHRDYQNEPPKLEVAGAAHTVDQARDRKIMVREISSADVKRYKASTLTPSQLENDDVPAQA